MSVLDDIDPAEWLALQAELHQRVDPNGETGAIVEAARSFLAGRSHVALGPKGQQLAKALQDVEDGPRDTATVMLVFGPRGWAHSRMAQMPAYRGAVSILETSGDLEAAEEAIEHGWDRRQVVNCAFDLKLLLPYDDETRDAQVARGELIDKAWAHHEGGAYEASIPIVLAQCEGLTYDATGKAFFTKQEASDHLVDDITLAGMNKSLPEARKSFQDNVRALQAAGSLSRHGVLHGREVAYGTKRNSVKTWALLAAVFDMAKPRLLQKASERTAEREQHWAGSDEVDERGRRRDRRGFDEARETLHAIAVGLIVPGATSGYPPSPPPIKGRPSQPFTYALSPDGAAWWAWSRAPGSGWVFAAANRGHDEWFWDGAEPPVDGPWATEGWTYEDDPVRPNWRGSSQNPFDVD